ncbi:K(+) efflux antiporter 5 [Porphyridium purpureum]|uniref:K(+) efflux antiporter 5 n=1 Tax=Porphyridium purpureum TaxID=35688 RepID=A0A5J4YQU3_PORPP|nr:K(+) efflux antiporter 5 [Porphyridium purpureum]|eukprot:POR3350..scf222_8
MAIGIVSTQLWPQHVTARLGASRHGTRARMPFMASVFASLIGVVVIALCGAAPTAGAPANASATPPASAPRRSSAESGSNAGASGNGTTRLFERFDLDGDNLLNEREVAALLRQLKIQSSTTRSAQGSKAGAASTGHGAGSSASGSGSSSGSSAQQGGGTGGREKGMHDVSLDGETISVGDSEFELLFKQLSNLKHTRDPSKDPRMSLQEDIVFIRDLMYTLAAAVVGGALVSYAKQPSLIGFLVGGMMIGPGGLNAITELVEMETLASVGIALILFSLGIEFSMAEILAVKRVALYGGFMSMLLTVALSIVVVPLLALADNFQEAIVVGLAVWLSSTAVVLQCTSPSDDQRTETARQQPRASSGGAGGGGGGGGGGGCNGVMGSDFATEEAVDGFDAAKSRRVMFALLIFQDVAIGMIIAILPALRGSLSTFTDQVLGSFLRLSVFVVLSLLVAEFLLPLYLEALDRARSNVIFTLGVIVFCLLFAYISERLGLAIELGAFAAGVTISESKHRERVDHAIRNIKDMFASIFFVCIGLMIHWRYFYLNFVRVILMLVFIICSKTLAMGIVIQLFGQLSSRTAWAAALALSQAGEFTFVIASKAQALQLFSGADLRVLNGATALSMLLTPGLVRMARRMAPVKTYSGI